MSDKMASSRFPLYDDLADYGKTVWWMILLRGIFAILFGIVAIAYPDATLVALAVLFAIYAIVDGVTTIVHAIRVRKVASRWGWLLAQGIVTLLVGIVALMFPVLTGVFGGLVIIYLISFWAVFMGVTGFSAAHAMASGGNKTWAYVAAALSVLFGIALAVMAAVNPTIAIWSLMVTIGVFAIILGVMLIGMSISVRSAAKDVLPESAQSAARHQLGFTSSLDPVRGV